VIGKSNTGDTKLMLPGENYKFKTDFIIKRNKSECEFFLEKDDVKMSLLNSTGGGILDVIMFALRISLLILKKKDKTNCSKSRYDRNEIS
jgi:hypothetical protein